MRERFNLITLEKILRWAVTICAVIYAVYVFGCTAAQSQTLTIDCTVFGAGERANELYARCKISDCKHNGWLCSNELMILPVSDGKMKVSTHPEGSRFTARWDETGIHFLAVTNIPATEWHENLRGKVYPWGEATR